MKELKEHRFIDDKMFGQMYINSEVIKKGKPLILITRKLELRGVPKDIIKELVQENQEDIGD
jgi:SOS response regulatory protein OraA/RecX